MTKLTSKHLTWYQNELKKDKIALDQEKLNLINQIKQLKKDDIVPIKREEKLTLWQRIKKVFMG